MGVPSPALSGVEGSRVFETWGFYLHLMNVVLASNCGSTELKAGIEKVNAAWLVFLVLAVVLELMSVIGLVRSRRERNGDRSAACGVHWFWGGDRWRVAYRF